MWANFPRLGVMGLLIGLANAPLAVGAQQPSVPSYNRDAPPGEPPPVPGQDEATPLPALEPEVQGRGPIHEAYAQPGTAPRPGIVVPKQPPAPIREMPPDQKPEGDNVAWVPGYWSWDEDRGDFLWVSGFWRVTPADRKWVPGYWTRADSGWQWVSGFWASTSQPAAPYVEEPPPASLDYGPSVPPPDDDSQYAPGCWTYREDRYVWAPGFWYRGRPGLLFTPPRWAWTPNGYLFVSGYWDYDLADRGVLFAPCYIPQALCSRPGWSFSPSYVLSVPALLASLWVRPAYGSYAFGDYYAGRYARLGYQPWLSYGPRYGDPLYGYYGWANRDNPAWRRSLVGTYNGRVRGDYALPPRTLAAQRALGARVRALPNSLQMVAPLSNFRGGRLRMVRTSAAERLAATRYARAFHQAGAERRTLETRGGGRSLPLTRMPTHPGIRSRTTPGNAVRALPRGDRPSAGPRFGNHTPSRPGPGSFATPRMNPPATGPRGIPARPNLGSGPRPTMNHATPQRPFRSAGPPVSPAPRMNRASQPAPTPRFQAPRPAPTPRMTAPRAQPRPAPHAAPHASGNNHGKR